MALIVYINARAADLMLVMANRRETATFVIDVFDVARLIGIKV